MHPHLLSFFTSSLDQAPAPSHPSLSFPGRSLASFPSFSLSVPLVRDKPHLPLHPSPPLTSPDSLWTCPYNPKTSSSLPPPLITLQLAPASSSPPSLFALPPLPLSPLDANSLDQPFPTSPYITITTANIYKQLLPLFPSFTDIHPPLLSPRGPYTSPLLGPLLALSPPAPALIQRWRGNGPLSIHRLR